MSSKLNVVEIITGHHKTLKNSDGTVAVADIFVFYLLPLFLSYIQYFTHLILIRICLHYWLILDQFLQHFFCLF